METERTRKSREKYLEKVRLMGGEALEDYINDSTKRLLKCSQGHLWRATPNNIKMGYWCKKCSGNCPEEARERFEQIIMQRGATVHGTYKTAHTKLTIICRNIHTFQMTPDKVKRGQWCTICPREEIVISYLSRDYSEVCKKEFEEIIKQRKWIVLGNYNRDCDKIPMKCEVGHELNMSPSSIRKGNGCYECYIYLSIIKLEDIVIYKKGRILEKYINNVSYMLFQCEHDHIWRTTPAAIKQGHWCSVCNESRMEKESRLLLEKFNIFYISQYSIVELYRKTYDYYFYYENNHYLLELDGSQHFEYSEFFHKNMDKFVYKQSIDCLKNFAALEFGYRLIRIDYTQIANIAQHINNAIQLNQQLYLSNTEMYSYLNVPIPPEIVIKHCPRLALKYNLVPHCGDAILEIVG